ncbi:MAG TPA: hypothetical protein VGM86_27935 [Thermoanaerobaculia bacterium]|jgi:hypothetical protein
MNQRRTLRVLKIVGIGILALGVFGLVVKTLWNWLMPELFGVHPITFAQALGVWILSRILLAGFHGNKNDRRWRGRLIDRWEWMTPEEREKLRARLRHRWEPFEEGEKSS